MGKNKVFVDLHIHTQASDGTCSPKEVVDLSIKKGLQIISITDHDTIEGIKGIDEYLVGKNIDFITGVELSTEFNNTNIHLLLYGFDIYHKDLNDFFNHLQERRADKAKRMIKKLEDLGFEIDVNKLKQQAKNKSIGRPHIAQEMVKKGYVKDIDEAFDIFLNDRNGKAYCKSDKIDTKEAIMFGHKTGAVSVLAHPSKIQLKNQFTIKELVKELKEVGLGGIEVYYPKQKPYRYKRLAEQYGLIQTVGSDYHGAIKNNRLGGIGPRITLSEIDKLRGKSYV